MRRQDYILRLIAEGARALHHILGLVNQRQHQAALRSIDDACAQLTAMRLAEALAQNAATLFVRVTFAESAELGTQKAALLAALLEQSGRLASAEGQIEQADHAFRLALGLRLRLTAAELPPFTPPPERLVAALGLNQLDLDLLADLLHYYRAHHEYARAEDILFTLLERVATPQPIRHEAITYYQHLLHLAPHQLEAGGLSLAEVRSTLAELQQL